MQKIGDLTFYSFDEMLATSMKSKTFRDGYYQESARLDLVRIMRELRRSHRLSRNRFAKKVGMSPAFLRKIENGYDKLSADILLQIASAFGKQVKLV